MGILGKIISCLALLTLAILWFSEASQAQVASADVTGTVTDTTGAAIPGAQVTIENQGTHNTRSITSNETGAYVFTLLQPGTYSVRVSAASFKTFESKGLVLAAGDRLRVDAQMAPGASAETVTVTAVTSALQSESTNVGASIDSHALQDIPLNGRNIMTVVQMSPGVNSGTANSMTSGTRPDDRRQSTSISANGQFELVNNQLIDGVDNNERYKGLTLVRPSVEGIQEVRVDTNLFTAEVSRTAGAAVNIITKSGTDDFHGSVYEYFRNDVTDAKNFFATGKKPELRQNQFGGSIGGPIIRSKTFFFADLEGFRQVDGTGTVYVSTVPTLYEKQNPGDLSDIGGPVIPASAIDPTSLAYFKLFPAPNLAGNVNNFLYTPAKTQNTILGDARIDHHFDASNSAFARYSYNKVDTKMPSPLPPANGVQAGGTATGFYPSNSQVTTNNAQLDYLHIFSSSLAAEAKAAYTLFQDYVTPPNYGKNLNDPGSPYSIPNANSCLECSGLATIGVTGYAALGDPTQIPILLTEHSYQYAASATFTHGHHSLKAGATLGRRQVSNVQNPFGKGYMQFTASSPVAAMTNFFHGSPFSYQRQNITLKPHVGLWETGVFAQDDWRALPSLTLNVGLRYDVFTAPSEKNGAYSNMDLVTAKFITGHTAGVNTSYVNWAPRFGFAYTPVPKTVIRGGFGLTFFASDIQNSFNLQNPPLIFASGTLSSSTPLSSGIISPVLSPDALTNPKGSVASKPLDFRDTYIEQFNLILQRDFAGNVVSGGYVGSLGRRIMSQIPNINLPSPAGPSPAGSPAPTPPYASQLPNVNTIQYWSDSSVSSYHSLQVSAQRRLQNNLTYNVNYTLAHAIDDYWAQADGELAFGLQPPLISTYDRGNSFLDVRHRIAATANYQIPFSKTANAVARAILANWQVNALSFWQTGTPFSIASAYTQNGRAQINLKTVTVDRPNVIGNPLLSNPSPTKGFFNTSAYALQPLGTAGNAGRNRLYGPHLRRTDLSLFKTVPVTERIRAQFRAECFNISNTPNFNQPNGQISAYSATADASGEFEATKAGGFGTITSTAPGYSGRQFQFALKILY